MSGLRYTVAVGLGVFGRGVAPLCLAPGISCPRHTAGQPEPRIRDHPDSESVGHVTSVRFVFYRLVAHGVIPKSYPGARHPAQDVSQVLAELRYQGVIPLGSIVDGTTTTEDYTGTNNFAEATADAIDRIRVNPWPTRLRFKDGTVHDVGPPELWTESRSLAGVIRSVAAKWRVPLVAAGGQASVGLVSAVVDRLRRTGTPGTEDRNAETRILRGCARAHPHRTRRRPAWGVPPGGCPSVVVVVEIEDGA